MNCRENVHFETSDMHGRENWFSLQKFKQKRFMNEFCNKRWGIKCNIQTESMVHDKRKTQMEIWFDIFFILVEKYLHDKRKSEQNEEKNFSKRSQISDLDQSI